MAIMKKKKRNQVGHKAKNNLSDFKSIGGKRDVYLLI